MHIHARSRRDQSQGCRAQENKVSVILKEDVHYSKKNEISKKYELHTMKAEPGENMVINKKGK